VRDLLVILPNFYIIITFREPCIDRSCCSFELLVFTLSVKEISRRHVHIVITGLLRLDDLALTIHPVNASTHRVMFRVRVRFRQTSLERVSQSGILVQNRRDLLGHTNYRQLPTIH